MNSILRPIRKFYRLIFPHRLIRIDDRGFDNVVNVGQNSPLGKELRIVFRGNHNIVVIGDDCKFYRNNLIFVEGDDNRVFIGDHTTFDGEVLIVPGEGTEINIGEDCMLAAHVTIRSTDQHPIYDSNGIRSNPAKNINIRNKVWLGAHSIVMKGVTIGNGTVVGYGSMVVKSLPDSCVAVGRPAHVIKSDIQWFRTFDAVPEYGNK